MAETKLIKSLKLVQTILKISKVLTIVGIVLILLLCLALPSMGDILQFAMQQSPEEFADLVVVLGEDFSFKELISYVYALVGAAVVGSVFSVMYLTKSVKLLDNMKNKGIFAEGYGRELRSIVKLMIIGTVVTYIAAFVLTLIMAPQTGTSSVTFDISTLVFAAMLSFASYLMDAAYENKRKLDEYITAAETAVQAEYSITQTADETDITE